MRITASLIRSESEPEAERVYRNFYRSIGFHEELERAILIHDLSVELSP